MNNTIQLIVLIYPNGEVWRETHDSGLIEGVSYATIRADRVIFRRAV